MHVTSASPLRVASRIWPTQHHRWTLTIVCKATYRLQPGESPLHDTQDPPHEDDTYWDDDPTRSLSVASDFAPFKPRADVVLVGSAYAPGQVPARSILARLIVGDLDRSLEAWCDRAWTQDGQLREGPRVPKVPLRYERAAGGPDSWNPVGVRPDAPPDPYGRVPLPNLQPPGLHITRRDDFIDPIGFGPIAPTWPSRWDRLGRHAGAWPYSRWWEQPLPEGFDPAFFNVAPRDQQLPELHDNERIILENLYPDHPRLVTNLPGLRPRAIAERDSVGREEIPLLCDTLWIDTDRRQCTLVWRGRLSLNHAEEPGRVVVTLEHAGVPLPPWTPETAAPEPLASDIPPTQPRLAIARAPAVDTTSAAELIDPNEINEGAQLLHTRAAPFEAVPNASPVLPFAPSSPVSTPGAPSSGPAGLPFSRPTDAVVPSSPHATTGTIVPVASSEAAQSPLPFSRSPESPPHLAAPPSVPLAPPPPPSVPIAPPPLVTRPPQLDPIAPPLTPGPWGAPDRGPDPAQRASIGQLATAKDTGLSPPSIHASPPPPLPIRPASPPEPPPTPMDDAAAQRGWKPVTRGDAKTSSPASPPLVANAARAGAGAAPNAAAAAYARPAAEPSSPAARHAPAPTPPREAIELLWYDPAYAPRIRRQPGWKEIMAQVKPHPLDDDYPGDAPPDKRQDLRDRREVFGLLARAEPTDLRGIEAALTNAVREDGTFVPPLVLVSGELEFPFDELETLKATIAAVMPFVAGDKKLKETVETTEQLLQTPWLKGANSVAEGLTTKIRETFAQGNRMLPARYLESHTERMLLEQRAYQKRTVLGKSCIRSLLTTPGSTEQVPVYLPESLGQEMPAFLRFGARMIAEGRTRVDQYESHPTALKATVLGRVLERGRR